MFFSGPQKHPLPTLTTYLGSQILGIKKEFLIKIFMDLIPCQLVVGN
jgi:hypothetical protein